MFVLRLLPFFILTLLWLSQVQVTPTALAADEKSVIGGTIYFDRNRDGSPIGGDPGLRGVQVVLSGPKTSRKATTDIKGTYQFEGLGAGEYRVSTVPPQGQQLTTAPVTIIKVDGRNAARVVDFGMAAIMPTATPSPSSTVRITGTPTASDPAAASAFFPQPLAASPPQGAAGTQASVQAALNARLRLGASPVPLVMQTVTPTPTSTVDGGRGGIPDGAPRLTAASLEALRYASGRDRLAAVKRWENGETIWLGVPFRTQMDGSYYGQVNCGPASLSMAMGAFGLALDPAIVREYVNFLSGNLDPDSGTSLDHLARVAREAGLRTLDLYSARGYRAWDLDLIRQHVAQGHPVITLTRYQSLPGNANSRFQTDHYIVITGLSGDDFIYNDPAYGSNAGYGLLISGSDLERAWVFSSIPGHSLALALDGDVQIPDWLRRRAEQRASAPAATASSTFDAVAMKEPLLSTAVTGQVPSDQELPRVSADAVAMNLLDALVAPRVAERAFVADQSPVEGDMPVGENSAAALVLNARDRTVRVDQVFIFDPSLVTLFLALLGIFIPPALSRRRR